MQDLKSSLGHPRPEGVHIGRGLCTAPNTSAVRPHRQNPSAGRKLKAIQSNLEDQEGKARAI